MKAYKIAWVKPPGDRYGLSAEHKLPRVRCEQCLRSWGNSMFEFPAFELEFVKKPEFDFWRIISLDEFASLKQRIDTAVGRSVNLVPGASIGPLVGTSLTTKLEDFIWGTIPYPQISRRALEVLRQAGIELETGRCLIKCRGKDVESHLALHLEPAALLNEECLAERMYVHCEGCGDYSRPPRGELLLRGVDPNPKRGYLIRGDILATGKDLVMMRESLEILASDRFREAVHKHKLTGLAFEECGEYV